MIKKYKIIGLFFTLTVLGAILLQSFHGYHHLENFAAEHHCDHQYNHKKTEINHTHHDFDHCFVCEFALGHFTKPDLFVVILHKTAVSVSYSFFYSKEILNAFRGSLFALRAPPEIIA